MNTILSFRESFERDLNTNNILSFHDLVRGELVYILYEKIYQNPYHEYKRLFNKLTNARDLGTEFEQNLEWYNKTSKEYAIYGYYLKDRGTHYMKYNKTSSDSISKDAFTGILLSKLKETKNYLNVILSGEIILKSETTPSHQEFVYSNNKSLWEVKHSNI